MKGCMATRRASRRAPIAAEGALHLIRYQIVKQALETPELGRYVSYGIEAVALPDGRRLAFVSDVSTDPAFAANLAERCTEGQLDPAQLLDVVLDAL